MSGKFQNKLRFPFYSRKSVRCRKRLQMCSQCHTGKTELQPALCVCVCVCSYLPLLVSPAALLQLCTNSIPVGAGGIAGTMHCICPVHFIHTRHNLVPTRVHPAENYEQVCSHHTGLFYCSMLLPFRKMPLKKTEYKQIKVETCWENSKKELFSSLAI